MAERTAYRKWRYNLDEVTENKRTPPTSLAPGFCAHIIGADMSVAGQCRPFPGWKNVHKLGVNVDGSSSSGGKYLETYDVESITDFFPITFKIGTANTVHGFVWRGTIVGESSAERDTVIIAEWKDVDGTWRATYIEDSDQESSGENYAGGVASGQLDVVVQGRLVYVFREGRQPFLFWVDPDDGPVVNTDTGPGPIFGSAETGPPTISLSLKDVATEPTTATKLQPGSYTFAIQLKDSNTGRVSALSEIITLEDTDEDWLNTAGDAQEAKFVELNIADFIGDVQTKWDQIIVYRSVRVEVAGGTFTGSRLFREALLSTANLPDLIATGLHDYEMQFTDLALVAQDPYQNNAFFLDDMPKAGSAALYQGTLFTANPDQEGTDAQAVGEIRWSHPVDFSPELFPPINRYVPKSPQDTPIRFIEVGDLLYGLSESRHYLIFKSGSTVAVQELNKGFGIVNQKAATTFQDEGFVVTHRGLVTVDQQGGVTPLNAIDWLLLDSDNWGSTLNDVWMGADDNVGLIVAWNKSKHEMVCFWANTRQVSELWDCSFDAVGVGVDPTSSTQENRLMVVMKTGQIMRIDQDREKSKLSFLDTSESNLIVTAAVADGAGRLWVDNDSSGTSPIVEDEIIGAWVYGLDGANEGERRQITGVLVNANMTRIELDCPNSPPEDNENFPNTPAIGDQFVISPVLFRIKGWPVPIIMEDGRLESRQDYFRGRVVNTMGAHFEDVSGGSASDADIASFRARLFKGLSGTAASTVSPVDGRGVKTVSVKDGAPRNEEYANFAKAGIGAATLFPELEVLVYDLDFRLLGWTLRGTQEASDTLG